MEYQSAFVVSVRKTILFRVRIVNFVLIEIICHYCTEFQLLYFFASTLTTSGLMHLLLHWSILIFYLNYISSYINVIRIYKLLVIGMIVTETQTVWICTNNHCILLTPTTLIVLLTLCHTFEFHCTLAKYCTYRDNITLWLYSYNV